MASSAEIQARVRISLYPEQDSEHHWACPVGIAIQLKKTSPRGPKVAPVNLVTSHEGITESVQLPAGTYQVNVTDPRFTLWEAAADLTIPDRPEAAAAAATAAAAQAAGEVTQALGKAAAETGTDLAADVAISVHGELLDVGLIPQSGRRLVVLRLVTEDGDQVTAGAVTITAADETGFSQGFGPCPDGYVYAVAPKGPVTFSFASTEVDGQPYCPQAVVVPYKVATVAQVKALEFIYWRQITIAAEPVITVDGTQVPLTGTAMTVQYQETSGQAGGVSRTKTLAEGDTEISFEYAFQGYYTVTLVPPPTCNNLPIQPGPALPTRHLLGGDSWQVPAAFTLAPTQDITISVQPPPKLPLTTDATFIVSYGSGTVPVPVSYLTDEGTAVVPENGTLTIGVAEGTTLQSGSVPLEMATPDQTVTPGVNVVQLKPEHSITITALNALNQPVSGAMIDVFRPNLTHFDTVVTDQDGISVVGLPGKGTYYVADHYESGQAGVRESVDVASDTPCTHRVRTSPPDGEALTDLSAYPVLTEEISTTGPPAPAGGGGGGSGGPGAGYGQTVEQVMRDVLGWRPSGDVAGFQAALTGAFELRQAEGHTEWAWQQRGYAVQADMGALTGAQASIYARAKSALDQMLPLLAGLTTLNPALWPPQDLEAIRTIVTAELNEVVTELALDGGPRIQRVDELFHLLTGERPGSRNLNPDLIQGNLGTLRDRFGLTVSEIDTVDDERIVTNFRIVVEQVLSLQASWSTDRELLSGVNSRTALGTILIWLSRGLEAVGESVDDLNFALDSVYVDAAQRQVIELNFALMPVTFPAIPLRDNKPPVSEQFKREEPPLLLSDLLDWVTRASRVEGPRLIQDAGKDGVQAFAPVLDKLRKLIYATRDISRTSKVLPPGMHTPRVRRALEVLAGQLDEATDLARLVKRYAEPELFTAQAPTSDSTTGRITLTLTGANFRRNASVVLIPQNREDLPDLTARHASITPPGSAIAHFRDPRNVPNSTGVKWLAVLTNDDGAETDPVEIEYLA
jgi:hypothetical protein